MAVNYSIGQAFEVIAKGEDVEAIADIARRFPMVAIHCAKLTGVADVAGPLLGAIPAYVSARKVEKAFKVGASEDVEDVEEAETEAEPEEEAEKPAPKKRARKPKAEPEPDPAESEGGKYDGMNAMELFKECKKRGIKAQPKKTAKFYKDLLEKNDAEGASDGEDEDDDWDI